MEIRNRNQLHVQAILAVLFILVTSVRGDTIGFFYALDADLQGLKSSAQESGQSVTVGSHTIQRLLLGSHSIYAVKMGSGAVETALSAQALLSRFKCDWAFSIGPGGALSADIKTGSWYRVTRVLAWQRGNSLPGGKEGSAAPEWTLDWNRLPVDIPASVLQTTGRVSVASGEKFISTSSDHERLRAATQADVVDMNSYGLVSACTDHDVPLFCWKVISDNADENAAEAFRNFVSRYNGDGGQALADLIKELPANPNDPKSYPAIRNLLEKRFSPSPE